jgi:hypothetical protein
MGLHLTYTHARTYTFGYGYLTKSEGQAVFTFYPKHFLFNLTISINTVNPLKYISDSFQHRKIEYNVTLDEQIALRMRNK